MTTSSAADSPGSSWQLAGWAKEYSPPTPSFSVVGRSLQRIPILQALLQSPSLWLPPAGHKLSVLPLFSPDTFPSILPAPAPGPPSSLNPWRSWNETSFPWAPFDSVPHFSLLPVVFLLLSDCRHHTGRACLFFFFFIYFISWRLITLQYCSGFCHA